VSQAPSAALTARHRTAPCRSSASIAAGRRLRGGQCTTGARICKHPLPAILYRVHCSLARLLSADYQSFESRCDRLTPTLAGIERLKGTVLRAMTTTVECWTRQQRGRVVVLRWANSMPLSADTVKGTYYIQGDRAVVLLNAVTSYR